jgi:hypothetical protein
MDFTKSARVGADHTEVQGRLVNSDGRPVEKLVIELTWEVPQSADRGGGRIGKFLNRGRDAANQTDVDGNVVFFVDNEDVDFVGPDHLKALRGLATHDGNVIKGDEDRPEVIRLNLVDIAQRERDLTAAAVTASCFTGDFSKVTGARVEFYDDTDGKKVYLDTVRFKITGSSTTHAGPDNAALVAVIIKNPDGTWDLRKGVKRYGRARDWKGLAEVCRTAVTR